jgi:hypothetical protein
MSELSRRLETLTEEELSRIYMEVFNTDNGKLVIEDLKNRCFAEISTITEGSLVDPYLAIRNEGRRSVLLHILTQLKPFETAEKKEE